MNVSVIRVCLVFACLGFVAPGPAKADDAWDHGGRYRYHDHEWKSEFRDGPCLVKRERDGNDSLLEVKCEDGHGARWRGEWKDEFRDGPCVVKIEAKHDEYKEEVECDPGRSAPG